MNDHKPLVSPVQVCPQLFFSSIVATIPFTSIFHVFVTFYLAVASLSSPTKKEKKKNDNDNETTLRRRILLYATDR
jgi:hypothetical protein